MPKRKSTVTSLAEARARRERLTTEVMECYEIGELFGSSSADPTSQRHTHVVMAPAPGGRSWAFDARRARGVAALLTAYAEWLDGTQDAADGEGEA